jgi:RNA polymerase sigma-B factor
MSTSPSTASDGLGERFDRERTRELFRRFARARDSGVRDELIVSHLNLARYLALRFSHRGEQIDDLVQVATLGLIKAIDRYDPQRGVEFATYAAPTIIGEIKRYFRDKGWAVRVPRRQQELNLTVNRELERASMELGRSPTVAELAARLGVSDEAIIEAQELGQMYNLLSIDAELAAARDATASTLLDYLGREDPELALFEDKAGLQRALHTLDPRERVILYLRFYENVSQAEVAKRFGVSQMHVSRLQARALEKLKRELKEE